MVVACILGSFESCEQINWDDKQLISTNAIVANCGEMGHLLSIVIAFIHTLLPQKIIVSKFVTMEKERTQNENRKMLFWNRSNDPWRLDALNSSLYLFLLLISLLSSIFLLHFKPLPLNDHVDLFRSVRVCELFDRCVFRVLQSIERLSDKWRQRLCTFNECHLTSQSMSSDWLL